jgi:drug/metabolite transporter (DMT)-like permease
VFSDQPNQILAVLRSGETIEIGGMPTPGRVSDQPRRPGHSRTAMVCGFAAIYLIWGSTYLGIRYAVQTIPPLLMMGVRHLIAGTLVYIWARGRGEQAPDRRQWAYAAIAGALLFLGGHGTLAWAEQKVPSGLAALLSATLPLWTVLLSRIDGTERKLGMKAWAGLLLGFAGVGLLVGPDGFRQGLDLVAAGMAVLGALLWAAGTSYTRLVAMPRSKTLAAAMQMIAGGTLLLVLGLATGEAGQVHAANVTARSLLSLAYLIVFGSIIAFTVYTWLVSISSPSMLSTYAYVNPVVAVFLGWFFAGETIGLRILAATAIILSGVGLVSTRRKQPSEMRMTGEKMPRQAWEPAGD